MGPRNCSAETCRSPVRGSQAAAGHLAGGSRDGFNVTNKGPRGSEELQRAHRKARLMPETIYRVAEDRADAQRLLKLYGYIT
jgi:hypothetical protein